MTLAISKVLEAQKKAVICASTGNTSASAAAYAARAGLKCFVVIPEGKIAMGKLAQALMHGAIVLQIRGNFDEGLSFVKQIAQELPLEVVNSINPYRIPGQQTASFEIIEELGDSPDFHCIPVGNAANIVAYWTGYKVFHQEKKASKLPKMLGFQSTGAAPFVAGKMIDKPETIATAIRIGHPQSWDAANQVQRDSNGWFDAITDDVILETQKILAQKVGIFAEPAACAGVAGLLKSVVDGKIPRNSVITCTLTGHGLKDPDIAITQYQDSLTILDARYDVIKEAITKKL